MGCVVIGRPTGVGVDFRQPVMIRLSVVREEHGWSVRIGQQMSSPFRRRDAAIREARRLAAGIRSHGERVEVAIEGVAAGEQGGDGES